MKTIEIKIDPQILIDYPENRIGFVVFDNLSAVSKEVLPDKVDSLRRVANKLYGLTAQNLLDNPTIQRWRSIYQNCKVKPKTYKSSIEALSRRFIKNDYRSIHNVVDIYNYVSYGNLLPMGGYAVNEIEGAVILRYSKLGDSYSPLNGDLEDVPEGIVVYSDLNPNDNILCWMWNHKDSKRTMLHPETNLGLFIIDTTLKQEHERIGDAFEDLNDILHEMGAVKIEEGFIDIDNNSKYLEL